MNEALEHWWCRVQREVGRTLTPAERALVDLVCDACNLRPYHLGWSTLNPWGDGARVVISDTYLSTVDWDGLTRLVVLAHDRMLRAEIRVAGRKLAIVCHTRHTRDGSLSLRVPTIEAALATMKVRGEPRLMSCLHADSETRNPSPYVETP